MKHASVRSTSDLKSLDGSGKEADGPNDNNIVDSLGKEADGPNEPDKSSETIDTKESEGESQINEVMWNMINTIVGAGIVGTPAIYQQSGIIVGIMLILVFSVIIRYALNLMIAASKLGKCTNYEELCFLCFGKIGYISILISLFVYDFGAMLSYIIILGDASSNALCELAGGDSYCSQSSRQLSIFILSILLILPWCLFRDISKIERVSAVNVVTVVLIIFVVIFEYFRRLDNNNSEYIYAPKQFLDMFSVIGIIAFIFVNHDSGFLLYNTLKNPTQKRWNILTAISFLVASIIILTFSILGYLTFGQDTNDNLLNSYGTDADVLIIITRIIYIFTAALTFPTYFYVVRHVLHSLYYAITVGVSLNEDGSIKIPSIHNVSLKIHLLLTLPVFFVNLLLGLYITNLGFVMSVTGSLSAVYVAFVLPPVCFMKLSKNYEKKDFILPIGLFILGIFIAIFSTIITVLEEYVF